MSENIHSKDKSEQNTEKEVSVEELEQKKQDFVTEIRDFFGLSPDVTQKGLSTKIIILQDAEDFARTLTDCKMPQKIAEKYDLYLKTLIQSADLTPHLIQATTPSKEQFIQAHLNQFKEEYSQFGGCWLVPYQDTRLIRSIWNSLIRKKELPAKSVICIKETPLLTQDHILRHELLHALAQKNTASNETGFKHIASTDTTTLNEAMTELLHLAFIFKTHDYALIQEQLVASGMQFGYRQQVKLLIGLLKFLAGKAPHEFSIDTIAQQYFDNSSSADRNSTLLQMQMSEILSTESSSDQQTFITVCDLVGLKSTANRLRQLKKPS